MDRRRAFIPLPVCPHNLVNRERIRRELNAARRELRILYFIARSVICDMNQLVALCHIKRRIDSNSYFLRRLLLSTFLIVERDLIRSKNLIRRSSDQRIVAAIGCSVCHVARFHGNTIGKCALRCNDLNIDILFVQVKALIALAVCLRGRTKKTVVLKTGDHICISLLLSESECRLCSPLDFLDLVINSADEVVRRIKSINRHCNIGRIDVLDLLALLVVEVKLKAIQAGNGFSVVLFSDRIFICAHIYDIRRHAGSLVSSRCRHNSTYRKPGKLSVKTHFGAGLYAPCRERTCLCNTCQFFRICICNLINRFTNYGSVFTFLDVRHLSRLFDDLTADIGCFLHNRLCLIFDHDIICPRGKSRNGQHCQDHDRCDNERKESFGILF